MKRLRNGLISAVLCAPLPFAAPVLAAGPSATIVLKPEQIKKAGITVAPATAAKVAAQALGLSGTVIAPNNLMDVISMPATGVVQAIEVNPLDTVKAGQPIARIYSTQLIEMERDYLQADSRFQLSEQKRLRDEQLFAEGIIPESRIQDSRSMAQQAKAEVGQRKQTLKISGMGDAAIAALVQKQTLSPTMSLSAPAAGAVIAIKTNPGERLDAGAPIAVIARQGKRFVEIQATRAQADLIRVGDKVTLKACDAKGQVAAVASQVSASNQSILVRADFPYHECLRPNQFVEVSVSASKASVVEQGVRIPAAAVLKNGAEHVVFVSAADGGNACAHQRARCRVCGDRSRLGGRPASGSQRAELAQRRMDGAWP